MHELLAYHCNADGEVKSQLYQKVPSLKYCMRIFADSASNWKVPLHEIEIKEVTKTHSLEIKMTED